MRCVYFLGGASLTCPSSNQAHVFGGLDLSWRLFILLNSKNTCGGKVQASDQAAEAQFVS